MAEYGIYDMKTAYKYVTGGTQGLAEFVRYLNVLGYSAEMYCLPVNTDLLQGIADVSHETSASPSFGWIIPDDDPFFVEFKMRNL